MRFKVNIHSGIGLQKQAQNTRKICHVEKILRTSCDIWWHYPIPPAPPAPPSLLIRVSRIIWMAAYISVQYFCYGKVKQSVQPQITKKVEQKRLLGIVHTLILYKASYKLFS